MDSRDQSVFHILVATDNHLGFLEKDPIRGQDSFDTFEEILRYARDLEVDFMVLGGDLFHENKPSRKTVHTAMELLRHYCLGERECAIEFLSDPSVNFHSRFATPNYMDPNYNVSIPVFAIHGNHDDPAGDGVLSVLDILSTAGLINYFGRAREVDDITVSPIILRRADSYLALYGLGNIRDERLYRTFTANRVRMLRPAALQDANPDSWFNLMLFHQNRAARSPKNHIPEVFLDDFLDLVIWGHEHDCLIDPAYVPQRDFYVSQPGSSCITSLSEGESMRKHVALLLVKGNQFEMRPLPLRTIRPFIFADMILGPGGDAKAIQSMIVKRVEQMVGEAHQRWTKDNPDTDKPCPLPLVRLRLDYTGSSVGSSLNPQRFGQAYVGRVANPRDIIHLIRRRTAPIRSSSNTAINIPTATTSVEGAQVARVEDLVGEFLDAQKLDLLAQNEFSDIVKIFVEKDDRDAINTFLKTSLQRTIGKLKEKQQLESLRSEIERVKLTREEEWRVLNPAGEASISHLANTTNDAVKGSISDDENVPIASNTLAPAATPKPAARRGTAAPRGGKQRRATPLQLSNTLPSPALEEIVVKETLPPVKRPRWPGKK